MATTKKTARRIAVDQVADHLATVERWEAEQVTKQAELDELEARIGEEVLADETAADRLSASMQQLRDRIRIAVSAAAAARPKVVEAKRAVVLTEAEEWDATARRHRKALAAHEAATGSLLAQLRELDGVDYAAAQGLSKTHRLSRDADRAELHAWTLREIAEGRDPSAELATRRGLVDDLVYGQPASAYYGGTYGQELDQARRELAYQAHDADRRALVDRERQERQRPRIERALDEQRQNLDVVQREYERQDALNHKRSSA
jgi:hypothetical protein